MSFVENLYSNSPRTPHAEIVELGEDEFGGRLSHFPDGDALGTLGQVNFCTNTWIWEKPLELDYIPKGIAARLNEVAPTNNHTRNDTVIIAHGPLGERATGIPIVGRDNERSSDKNLPRNDGELTLLSTLPPQVLMEVINIGIKSGIKEDSVENKSHRRINSEINVSDWANPSWNIGDSLPYKINPFLSVDFRYWGGRIFQGYDVHFISSPDPVREFLAVYGGRYSNIFGKKELACFIHSDGSLTQRIWQPIKPERAPQNHYIKLVCPSDTLSIPFAIAETAKMAIDTVRYTKASRREAVIDPELIPPLEEALQIQTNNVKSERGSDWLKQKARKKLGTAIYRARLFDKKGGGEKVRSELKRVGWFKAVGIE